MSRRFPSLRCAVPRTWYQRERCEDKARRLRRAFQVCSGPQPTPRMGLNGKDKAQEGVVPSYNTGHMRLWGIVEELIGGGESGIRTHGTVARTPVFETGAFVHSAISPLVEPGRGLASFPRTLCRPPLVRHGHCRREIRPGTGIHQMKQGLHSSLTKSVCSDKSATRAQNLLNVAHGNRRMAHGPVDTRWQRIPCCASIGISHGESLHYPRDSTPLRFGGAATPAGPP